MKKNFFLVLFILIYVFSYGRSVIFNPKIKIWHAWTGKSAEKLNQIIEKFAKEENMEIEISIIPFDVMRDKFIKNSKENKEKADIIIGPADWIGEFADNKIIEAITENISENELKEFIKSTIDSCTYEEKTYGLPLGYKVAALIYNKDILEKPPYTTKDMIETAKKIENNKNIYGLVYEKENYYFHVPWLGFYDLEILNKEKEPVFDMKEHINTLEFIKNISEGKNKIIPEENDYNTMMKYFKEGKAAMIINGSWALEELINSGIKFGIARLPISSETGKYAKPIVGAEVVMIATNVEHKNSKYKLLKYLTSDDVQAELFEIGNIPSRKNVYDYKKVKNSKMYEYLERFKLQAEYSVPMPRDKEMSAVWSNGGFLLKAISSGEEIEKSSKEFQKKAIDDIKKD